MALRRAIHALGLRYRVHRRPIPDLRRTADVVFMSARVAVFVDGCFWHGCEVHRNLPASNRDWWAAKIAYNRRKDADTNARLLAADWLPIRVWEHDDPVEAAHAIAVVVSQRSGNTRPK